MVTISVAEARRNFASVLDQIGQQAIVIQRRGKAAAVLVDVEEFERMYAALEEREDVAAFDAALMEDGDNLPWELALADLGWA